MSSRALKKLQKDEKSVEDLSNSDDEKLDIVISQKKQINFNKYDLVYFSKFES